MCPDCEIDHEHGDCPTAPAPEATAAMEKKTRQGERGTGKGKQGERQGTPNSARCPTAPTLNDWLNAGDAATASPACACADCLNGVPPRNPLNPSWDDFYVMQLHRAESRVATEHSGATDDYQGLSLSDGAAGSVASSGASDRRGRQV